MYNIKGERESFLQARLCIGLGLSIYQLPSFHEQHKHRESTHGKNFPSSLWVRLDADKSQLEQHNTGLKPDPSHIATIMW